MSLFKNNASRCGVILGCRPWNLSLTSVIILALSNMLLTFLLLQSETCAPEAIPREVEMNAVTEWNLGTLVKHEQQSECITQDYQPASPDANSLKLDIKLGRWDARRMFRMYDSVLVGSRFTELSQTYRVCLATQSSVEKLHSLVQVALHWTGPMSVALYAAGDEEFEVLQRYLVYLRRCYESIRERVIFSLAVPKMRMPKKQPRVFELPDRVDCAKPEATLNEFMSRVPSEQTNWRIRNVYPQNHMRNLARKNCQTDYVFLTDVDIVPSFNLTVVLDEFLRNDNCDKCAYVIPTYELDTRVRFPPNKTELIRLATKGLARPFHQKVFIHNQFATNFTRWLQDVSLNHVHHENVKTGKVYISHDVTNFEFLYEPFYVAKDIVPPHDERFMGYGYTRNTQHCIPLNIVCLTCPGWQTEGEITTPSAFLLAVVLLTLSETQDFPQRCHYPDEYQRYVPKATSAENGVDWSFEPETPSEARSELVKNPSVLVPPFVSSVCSYRRSTQNFSVLHSCSVTHERSHRGLAQWDWKRISPLHISTLNVDDRLNRVYEMYVTGYQFKVLSPVFTGHWGLQTRKTRPAWRERQNSANRKQFETFKKEVFARYMRDPLKMMKNAN
ncbi:N-acetyllactosaminide beta-1,3-N-acetylglucosaminyltransferase [Atta colombica]|uniref:Beta-1,4-glucuronyltransferase 1 n=1 Tax=Atta colombica TaxID=520822 RepID=A0A195B0J0_9HYME|nr:N-acetyllactosaminide beta-1,3-N-acetylglucosaminyltransferase [Atta colombica]